MALHISELISDKCHLSVGSKYKGSQAGQLNVSSSLSMGDPQSMSWSDLEVGLPLSDALSTS